MSASCGSRWKNPRGSWRGCTSSARRIDDAMAELADLLDKVRQNLAWDSGVRLAADLSSRFAASRTAQDVSLRCKAQSARWVSARMSSTA